MSAPESTPSAHEASKVPPSVRGDDEIAEAEKPFKLRSAKFWIVILSVYAAIFLVALDRMIVATAIPKITDEFHSIEDIGWYGSAYMMTCAIFFPLGGRVYQLYSTKWVFLLSVVVFEVGSAICGAAPSSASFIVGRAIAGIGAAGIFCGGIMIIIPLVPLHKRPMFTSFLGMAFGISSVLGPLVGGAFTDSNKLTWRWCFYINLPVGGFTLVAILFFLHLPSEPRERLSLLAQLKRLDPLGLFFFIPCMISLILALQWGGSTYAWSAPRIIGLLVTFAVTFIIFLVVEYLFPETAMAPPRVVLNRSVAGSMLYMLLLSGGMMAVAYYLPIWFQAAQGKDAIQAGIRLLPLVLALTVFGIVSAVLTQKIGYYVPAMLLSLPLCATGCGLLSTLTPSSGRAHWIGYQVLYGAGIGSGFQTCGLAPQTVLPKADVPLGMAMMFFMQQLGGAVFVAVAQSIFASKLVDELDGIAGLDTTAIINTGATALRKIVPPSELVTVLEAYSYALTRVFIMAVALSACMTIGVLAVEWRSIKEDKTGIEAGKKGEGDLEEDKNGANAEKV